MSIYFVLLLILISCVIFIFCVLFLTARYKRILLGVCFVFIATGFIIYTKGYLSSGMGFTDSLFAALRGMFSTARMFSANEDYGILADLQGTQWLTENICIKIILWCCFLSAPVIVYIAFITFFGRKFIDNFRLFFGSHKEVYIIKGFDKNAFFLAENIVTHDAKTKKNKPDNKRLVVFLLEEEDDEKKISEKAARFGGIVKMLDRKHDLKYYIKKAKLKKRNWIYNLLVKFKRIKEKKYYIILMPQNTSTMDDVRLIVEYAKEKKVKHEELDIFVFTSSEWEREKIEEITQLKESNQRKYPYTFHIVNEIELLTRQMINKHPPYECKRLNFSGGTAECDFTVMIIGFGPVGQSALLRLVMNGQFMGSRMRAIIVDNDIENLQDCFIRRYPCLDLCCKMEFVNINVLRNKFINLLNNEKNIDYIVTALHSDEMNKQIALDIKHHYETNDIKELPFIAVAEMNGSLREINQAEKDKKRQDKNKGENIFVFGSREEIYKESVIIRQKADLRAQAVNKVYDENTHWHELNWFTQESNRAAADFIPAMLKLAKLSEEEAMNRKTLTNDDNFKKILAQTEHLRWNAFHAAMGYRPISVKEMIQRFDKYTGERDTKDHLTFCRRDEKYRLHVCLVPWEELEKINEAYHKLACRTNVLKEQNRDFMENDLNIIVNIPKFLEVAREEQT